VRPLKRGFLVTEASLLLFRPLKRSKVSWGMFPGMARYALTPATVCHGYAVKSAELVELL
jgi:hypothetical protein